MRLTLSKKSKETALDFLKKLEANINTVLSYINIIDSSAIPFDVCGDVNDEIKEYESDDSEKEIPHSIRKEHSLEDNIDYNQDFPFIEDKYEYDAMSPEGKNITIEFKSRNSYPLNSNSKENLSRRLNTSDDIIR